MNNRLRLKINLRMLPLQILLVTACLKWLIEGILDMAILEVALLLLGIGFVFLKKGLRVNANSLPWLFYIFNIVLSLAMSGADISLWGRASVTILSTMFVFFIDAPVRKYESILKFLVKLGYITAITVIVHFLLGNTFNKLYFPLLNETARSMADLYARSGYFFGLLYNPHEPAGLLSFSIVALVLWPLLARSPKKWYLYLFAVLLAVPLLMTGKKGIFVCMVLALSLTILMLYGSRKQLARSLGFVFGVLVLAIIFVVVALRNPQIAVFARFNEFFQGMFISNSVDDSGRMTLYMHAFNEWSDNKLFGIGWRQFNGLTTTKFKMFRSHEVNCDYLQWLTETGVVGFILSIVPVAITGYRAVIVGRKLIRQYSTRAEQWVLLMAVHIQMFTLIYAFIEIPFFDIVFFAVYILSCIIINSAYARRKVTL